jgi:ribosome maturation protein SDO1
VALRWYDIGKKRYELACYKNKILEWRSGTETDLDNVLQVHTVFTNVSKGATAPHQDLEKSFPKLSLDDIIQEILKKGEIQVGEKERRELLERVEKELIEIVSGKLVDPSTKRVYTPGMIGKALDQLSSQAGHAHTAHHLHEGKGKGSGPGTPANIGSANVSGTATPTTEEGVGNGDTKGKAKELPTWTGVVAARSAKSQALDAMKALIAWQPIPVMRARMRLRVTCPTSILKTAAKPAPTKGEDEDLDGGEKVKGTVKDRILSYVEQVETQDVSGEDWEVVGFAEPGAFKGLTEFVGGETKGRGRVEVLDMAVTHED